MRVQFKENRDYILPDEIDTEVQVVCMVADGNLSLLIRDKYSSNNKEGWRFQILTPGNLTIANGYSNEMPDVKRILHENYKREMHVFDSMAEFYEFALEFEGKHS